MFTRTVPVWLGLCLAACRTVAPSPAAIPPAATDTRPRLIVTTDIGGDPDDEQSLVRLLVFNDGFRIEGLIASASGTPGELKRHEVRPDLIHRQLDAYAEVFAQLSLHAPGFARPEDLRNVVKSGNPLRGRTHVGEGEDTEGSNWIINRVDAAQDGPVHVAVWGGPTELAQALYRIKHDRTPAELARFVAKLRVHAIGHQDDSGPYILETFPDLFYVLDVVEEVPRTEGGPKIDRRPSAYRGMYLGGDESLTSAAWIEEHVRSHHGPLGALYPAKTWTAPNPHGAMKEGDSPSWLYFLPLGLSDSERPSWGGWGGRFKPHPRKPRVFRDAQDTVDGKTEARATVYRWRPAFQNAFAARMDWCVKEVAKANHPPRITLEGDASMRPLVFSVRPGQGVGLDASQSRDPDGDALTFRWWAYEEAGNVGRETLPHPSSAPRFDWKVPSAPVGSELHLILEVTDAGEPALTSYRRVVLRWMAPN